MTDQQKLFFELAKKHEDLIDQIKAVKAEMDLVMSSLGLNTFHQDVDGTVYQVVKPTGRFVYFSDLDYVRTKKGDEKSGSLSLKKAEEMGFTVK